MIDVGVGILLGFLFGSFFYLIGFWGGGDAKFLLGFSASTPYLISFFGLSNFSIIPLISDTIFSYSSIFVDFFSVYLLFINLFLILGAILYFFKRKSKLIRKDVIRFILIILFLSFGIYFGNDDFYLFFFGVLGFIIFFFSSEEFSKSFYFVFRKKRDFIEPGDCLDGSIVIGDIKIHLSDCKYGLNIDQVNLIKSSPKKSFSIRWYFPISQILFLNFFLYGLLIISSDEKFLVFAIFILLFLLFSFFLGGINAILVIIFNLLRILFDRNRSFNFSFTFSNKLFFLISLFLFISSLLFSNFILLLFSFIILLYLFLIVLKKVESELFLVKRNIDDLVPGDWVLQDIQINGKLYFTKDNFSLGIDEFQIEKLKKFKSEGLIDYVLVKDGIAFMPSFFIAFLFLFLFFL